MERPKIAAVAKPILWAVFIAATSSTVVTTKQLANAVASSPVQVSADSFSKWWLGVWWFFVKGWHALEFAILAALVYKCLKHRDKLLIASFIAMMCAFLDEFHQVYVSGRGGRLSDVLIDWVGIGLFWYSRKPDKRILNTVGLWLIAALAIFYLAINPSPTFDLPGAESSGLFSP